MRRPYSFTRTSSSHARYNPIYEETEAKIAEASGKSRWSFPFFTSSQPAEHETLEPQPRKSSPPPPRTSGTFFATNHNTYSPTDSTDNIYDAAENSTRPASNKRKRFSFPTFPFFGTNNNDDGIEGDDDYNYQSYSFNDGESRTNPFVDPGDNLKKESKKEKEKKKKQKPPTSTKDSDNKKPSKSWQERGSARRRTEVKEEKEKTKERERARKRNSGLGWAKSWSFGGERFGGTILADGSGVRIPIFRCKGPCGLSCGF